MGSMSATMLTRYATNLAERWRTEVEVRAIGDLASYCGNAGSLHPDATAARVEAVARRATPEKRMLLRKP